MTLDPYVEPASGVLCNRLGISDPDRLGKVEAALTEAYSADVFGALGEKRYLRGLSRDDFTAGSRSAASAPTSCRT